uniref:superoxide dismutase n=2 Tax=Rhizophora mucronata TaxID=61149 RepID=A0A2P2KG67_RHIMU
MFELKPPPYPLNALEPHMSKDTLEFHWGKHHRAYVDNLNKQINGTELVGLSLEDVIVATYNKGNTLPAFNNAAQVGCAICIHDSCSFV